MRKIMYFSQRVLKIKCTLCTLDEKCFKKKMIGQLHKKVGLDKTMAITTGVLLWDFLGVIVALLSIFYAYFKWNYQYWKKKGVPYLEPTIPFGNMPSPISGNDGIRTALRQIYEEAKSKGWRYCGIYNLATPIYFVLDLELIKSVMTKDFNHFVDRGVYYNEKDDPISAHLFTLGGKRWRNLRVKLTPTFTSGKLKAMFQTLVDCGLVMEDYIVKNVDSKEPVDIKDILSRFTTNIIGSCAFGIDCNSFEDPISPFRENAKNLFERRTRSEVLKLAFAQSFPTLGRALGFRFCRRDVSDFYTKVVEDTVKYRLEKNYVRKDLLQLLINMMKERQGSEDGYKDDGNSITMKEIVAQCFLFFIAGFETSSTTMTFALLEMALNPDIQEKARKEVTTVLAQNGNQMTYDALGSMKYLKQVIDETLRMYPPVPFLSRECVEDYKIPDENVVIEKGRRVFVPLIALHYDKEYFPDPEKFDPDRFSEENKTKIPQYAHIPFGEGPRICIGERFGIMQTKVGLACLLRNFKITMNKKTKMPITLNPRSLIPIIEGGLWLNLEKL